MARVDANNVQVYNGVTRARSNVTTTTTVQGNKAIWNISAAAAAYTLTVEEYDSSQYKCYDVDKDGQPVIIIKCSADCSVNNVAVKSSDGAAGLTTHYTFAADYSSTPRYVALRLSATEGADGTRLWEAA